MSRTRIWIDLSKEDYEEFTKLVPKEARAIVLRNTTKELIESLKVGGAKFLGLSVKGNINVVERG